MSNENQAPAVQDGDPATQIPAGVETAAVPETNVDAIAAEGAEAAEAAAAEVAAEAAKVVEAVEAAEAPKESRERNEPANGVVRPSPDTKTGAVWRIADEMTKQLGHPAKRKDVLAESAALGITETTAATQYGRWRKFNGLEGRDEVDATAKPAKQTKAEKAAAAAAAAEAAIYAPTAKVIEE